MKKYLFIILLLFIASPVFASDIVNHTGLKDNLQACYDLEEASGERADSSANGNNLTDNETVGTATGHIGEGADFESANGNESLSISNAGHAGTLDLTGDWTISIWMNQEGGQTGSATLTGTWNTTSQRNHYFISDTVTQEYVAESTSDNGVNQAHFNSRSFPTDNGTFYHVVLVHDATNSTTTMWGDNVGLGTATSYGTLHDSTDAFYLGATHVGTEQEFDGVLDIVSVYDVQLTREQVALLFNSGTGIPCGTIAAAVEDGPQQGEIWFNTTYNFKLEEHEDFTKV